MCRRARYVDTLSASLRDRGFAIISTCGPDGPTSCSGLPVQRYSIDEFAAVLAAGFELVTSRVHEHHTPAGVAQQFVATLFRRVG